MSVSNIDIHDNEFGNPNELKLKPTITITLSGRNGDITTFKSPLDFSVLNVRMAREFISAIEQKGTYYMKIFDESACSIYVNADEITFDKMKSFYIKTCFNDGFKELFVKFLGEFIEEQTERHFSKLANCIKTMNDL